jgi:hypothetical protein
MKTWIVEEEYRESKIIATALGILRESFPREAFL